MSIIAEISALLNDAEEGFANIRWSVQEIQEYVNDALVQLALLKPEAFAKTVEMPLKAGSYQELPEDIMQLIDLIGVKDAYGRIHGKPLRLDTNASYVSHAYFADLACQVAVNGRYVMRSYVFDPKNPQAIFVYPPVPAGEELSLLVNGVVVTQEGKGEVPRKWHNAVIEWALYRAFSKDTESPVNQQKGSQHLQHFYSILNLSTQAEDRLNRFTVLRGGTS